MRPLTAEQSALLEQRRQAFGAFYAELMPVLADFAGRLGVVPPHTVLTDASAAAGPIGRALAPVAVRGGDDRVWLVTRVGYFVGEYFVQTFGGCWYVDDDAGSQSFGRFVVGRFAAPRKPAARVDPFEVAADYVDAGPGRDLGALLGATAAHCGVR